MKKIICLLMVMVFVCLFVGCGKNEKSKTESTTENKDAEQLKQLKESEEGDIVKFGIKPNSDMLDDGSLWIGEDWEWLVVFKDDADAILLSKDYLFKCEYDEDPKGGYVYYDSHVADLLFDLTDPLMSKRILFGENTDRIEEVPIESSVGGDSEEVKMQFFLLSEEEVDRYMYKEDRIMKDEDGEEADWWLRSVYKDVEHGYRYADIIEGDKIREAPVVYEAYCRPACKVNLLDWKAGEDK